MANLQIKGIQEELYNEIKRLALAENRSVSQQILFLVREHLAFRGRGSARTPAQVLLDLAGSWEDERDAAEIIDELRKDRRSSRKLAEGL
jgi:hypothetical protein